MLSPEWLKISAVAALLALFGVLETLMPARKWHAPRSWRWLWHGVTSGINSLIVRLIFGSALTWWCTRVSEWELGILNILHLEECIELMLGLIVYDFLYYWWHRWNHTFAWLWRFHKVHHVDTHLDVTTGLRFHLGELLVSVIIKLFWVVILGPSASMLILFELFITAAALFHHTNFDLGDIWDQRLRKIVVTPRYHTAHHTVAPQSREANFGTLFSCWDRLFGSYVPVDRRDLVHLGLPRGRNNDLTAQSLFLGPFGDRY